MKRPSSTLMAITMAAGFLAAIITACDAHAGQPIPQDAPAKAIQRERFLRLYAQTASCMRQASVAMLRQGSRDRDDIMVFSMKACGPYLFSWLQSEEGATQEQALGALDLMAGKALDAALRGPDFIITH